MKEQPDPPTIENEGACPRCGEARQLGASGVCAKCFAQCALADDTGWLAALDAEPAADDAWPVVMGWKITGILGAGGMGRVYRAESARDDTPGALKVLEGKWSRDPLMSARFEAEALALMNLHHENIVRVLETGETNDGRFFLVMELVDGCDLGRLLRAEKLPPERAMDIFQKVCAATAHAHEQGFAHRDIKPANILIARDGTVKLVDFGLAKNLEKDGGSGSTIGALTATTDHFGTAYYLAPERILSKKNAGPPADIYALGVLLYHLLAGQMPIGNYTPLSQAAALPKAFDAIVAEALEAEPTKRTASVREISDAVEKAWRDHLSGADRLRKRRRVFVIAALAVFACAAAIAGALWQRERMRPPPPPLFAAPSTATQTAPWENSLGMKFVPVPGTRVLFSIWEARRKDVEPHILAESGLLGVGWKTDLQKKAREAAQQFTALGPGGRFVQTASWKNPGFPVTPDHPACFIGVREAQRYCHWLSWKEHGEGRLKPGQFYRLPTSAEWLVACGGVNAAPRPGNVAGPEARDENWPPLWPTFDTRDDFPRLAPVGSFPAELYGLFDISGNVSEWAIDEDESAADPLKNSSAVLRGPNFIIGTADNASFDKTKSFLELKRWPNIGFRIVLEHETGETDDR